MERLAADVRATLRDPTFVAWFRVALLALLLVDGALIAGHLLRFWGSRSRPAAS